MKKRITAIVLLLVLFIFASACAKPAEADNDIPPEAFTVEGVYLKGKTESLILIENEGPVVMRNMEKEDIFSSLSDGDKIKITCTAIEESYPGGTGVYSLELVSKGTFSDVDKSVYAQLAELGWVETGVDSHE